MTVVYSTLIDGITTKYNNKGLNYRGRAHSMGHNNKNNN